MDSEGGKNKVPGAEQPAPPGTEIPLVRCDICHRNPCLLKQFLKLDYANMYL